MTGHREPWYLDRLRAELERAAESEDRRERRGALGRVRVRIHIPLKPVLAFAAIVVVAIAVAVAVAALGSGEDERSAAPPAPTPVPGSPQAVLEHLDGIYDANVTTSVIAGTELLPTGLYRLTIRAAENSFVLSDPENGAYEHTITGASPHRLAFAPDGNCEVPEQRPDPATVEFSLKGSFLTLRNARGGCQPIWQLLTSTPWYKRKP
jgi:hypothetical protein